MAQITRILCRFVADSHQAPKIGSQVYPNFDQKRGHKNWPESRPTDSIFMPPSKEDRLLPTVLHTPVTYPDVKEFPFKYPKHNFDMRGPEPIHNQLIYKQYGIISLGGGAMSGSHFDIITTRVNKYMDTDRFFAVWRVDPPWKPKSKKSLGKKMGGGKAKVHHFETPIKAGRVIIEVAGIGEFGEMLRIFEYCCKAMPFYCRPISQQIMDDLKAEKLDLDAKNYNPFDYRQLVRKNYTDCQRQLTPYEALWGGTYF